MFTPVHLAISGGTSPSKPQAANVTSRPASAVQVEVGAQALLPALLEWRRGCVASCAVVLDRIHRACEIFCRTSAIGLIKCRITINSVVEEGIGFRSFQSLGETQNEQ